MNVLWIAYQAIPCILEQIESSNDIATGGWIQGIAETIMAHDEIELSYCFQYHTICEGKTEKLKYYTINQTSQLYFRDKVNYKKEDFERFKYILRNSNPDVIQIYGTETWFQRQFVKMAKDLGITDKIIVWIQGMPSFYSRCYTNGLTIEQIKRTTLWEIFRGSNIEGIQKRLALNGRGEYQILDILKNVIVRTDWDSACCKAINPQINLYYCNETLRPEFYENKVWDIEKIEKHSIFMSQYISPIKGFHQMLKALPIILNEFPDTIVYTTGNNPLDIPESFIKRIREPSYIRILREEIKNKNLEDHVKFLGTLQAEKMQEKYLKSHVFISASSIENSPNSIGEAMILGLPIISSDVGGVSSMLTHKIEGILYPYNEEAILAKYVCKIFRNDTLAMNLSKNARKQGLYTHDRERNYQNLLKIYKQIIEKEYSNL